MDFMKRGSLCSFLGYNFHFLFLFQQRGFGWGGLKLLFLLSLLASVISCWLVLLEIMISQYLGKIESIVGLIQFNNTLLFWRH